MTEQLLYLPAPGVPNPPIVHVAAKPAPPLFEVEPWERQHDESTVWFRRFQTQYLALGPKRTMSAVLQNAGLEMSSVASSRWRKMYRDWKWKERAEAWDDHCVEEELQRRNEILKTGIALDHERVLALKDIGELEKAIIIALAQAIIEDPTSAKAGKLVPRFAQIKAAYSDTLKAVADETGGRAKKINIHTELESYAVTFAREQGVDEATARSFAKIIELEAKNSS